MQIKHLDHLNLSVSNLDATTDFYARFFGFQVVEDGESGGIPFRVLRGGEAMLCIYEQPQMALENNAQRRQSERHGINHFAFRIDDEQAWLDVIAREQPELLYGGRVQHPHSTAWYVADPDGYEIEVALWKNDQIAFEPMQTGA